MAGIFQNGWWSLGFDFITSISPGGLITAIGSSGSGSLEISSSYARFSGKGVRCDPASPQATFIGRTLGVNLQSFIIGIAFNTQQLPAGGTIYPIITFWDTVANVVNCSLGYNAQGQVGWYSAGGINNGSPGQSPTTQLGNLSASGIITVNSYICIECLVTIGVSGLLQCNVNGQNVLTYTGSTIKTNAWTNEVFIGCSSPAGAYQYYDDWYMLDLTGAAPFNTFLGKWRIQTDGPNADSATGGLNTWAFTTPQGSDFANCANIPLNAAQFNSSATVGARMSFRFPSLNTSRVYGLNTWMSLKEDSAGSRAVAPIFRSNGVDQTGTTIVLPGSDTFFNQNSVIDPNTGLAWSSGSVAAAQSCEIGLIVNA
jgi:hypothetical protein